MTDTVNVPCEWLKRLDYFLHLTGVSRSHRERKTISAMLAAAPKAEPVSDPYKLVREAINGLIEWDKKTGFRVPYRVRDPLYSALASVQPLSNPQQLDGEDAAWAWVNGRVECDPADIDYSADEMVDAFMAGQASRRDQPEAPKVEQEPTKWEFRIKGIKNGFLSEWDECDGPDAHEGIISEDVVEYRALYTRPAPSSDELLEKMSAENTRLKAALSAAISADNVLSRAVWAEEELDKIATWLWRQGHQLGREVVADTAIVNLARLRDLSTHPAPASDELLEALEAWAVEMTAKHGNPNGTDYEQGQNDMGVRVVSYLRSLRAKHKGPQS